MRLLLSVLVFFLVTSILFGQNKKILDSLQLVYNENENDTSRILVLSEIAKQYYRSDPDTAIALATQAAEQSERISFDKGKARAYNIIGLGNWVKSNHAEALANYQKSLPYFARSGDKQGYAFGLNNIGLIYYYQNNFQLASEFYQKALALHEETGNQEGIGLALNNIGLNYEAQGNFKLALEYYQNALNIYQKAGIKSGTGQSLTNIGYAYFNQQNYDLALDYQQKAAVIQQQINDKSTLVSTLLCIAEIYQHQKKYDQSTDHAKRALQIATEIKSTFDIKDATRVLYETSKTQGNFQVALSYLESFKILNDSIFSIENTKAIASLENKVALEGKQREIEALEQQRRQQQLLNYIVISGLVCLGILVFFILRNRKKLQDAYNELEATNNKLIEVKEEVEVQAEMLSKSNHTKDKIFSIVSHDLRSPLTALRGVFTLMENKELSIEELKNFVPELSKRVSHASDIAEELLHWSRSQMDVIEIHPVEFNIVELLGKKKLRFAQSAGDKGVTIHLDIPERIPSVYADLDMVKTVLRNLISNAIKFTSPGGNITLSAVLKNSFVEICVIDNGMGIRPEDVGRMFKEHGFTTAGTADEKGTGLGLMLCRDFIEKNGGRIWVESEWGKGSSFCFTIPVAKT
jgi:two-component system sensor histidine kinase/response regulator